MVVVRSAIDCVIALIIFYITGPGTSPGLFNSTDEQNNYSNDLQKDTGRPIYACRYLPAHAG